MYKFEFRFAQDNPTCISPLTTVYVFYVWLQLPSSHSTLSSHLTLTLKLLSKLILNGEIISSFNLLVLDYLCFIIFSTTIYYLCNKKAQRKWIFKNLYFFTFLKVFGSESSSFHLLEYILCIDILILFILQYLKTLSFVNRF